MSGGMPELGSKISLISKADIRYEGRLYTVDPQECTIALSNALYTSNDFVQTTVIDDENSYTNYRKSLTKCTLSLIGPLNQYEFGDFLLRCLSSKWEEARRIVYAVRSFGTEDRDTQFQIAPQSQIYDYILFRGSDIKDIRVVNNSLPHPNDPAIMQVQLPNGQHLMPHFSMPSMNPPQLQPMAAAYGNPFGAMAGIGAIGGSGASGPASLAPGGAAPGPFMLGNQQQPKPQQQPQHAPPQQQKQPSELNHPLLLTNQQQQQALAQQQQQQHLVHHNASTCASANTIPSNQQMQAPLMRPADVSSNSISQQLTQTLVSGGGIGGAAGGGIGIDVGADVGGLVGTISSTSSVTKKFTLNAAPNENQDPDMLAGASRSTTPISLVSRKSPLASDMGVQVTPQQSSQNQQQHHHHHHHHHNNQNNQSQNNPNHPNNSNAGHGGNSRDAGHKRQNHQQQRNSTNNPNQRNGSNEYYQQQPLQQQQNQQLRDRRDSGRNMADNFNNQNQHHDSRNNYNHHHQGQGQNRGWTMHRNPNNAPNMMRNRGSGGGSGGRGRMQNQGYRPMGGPGANQNKPRNNKNTIKFEQDFDFEQANNKFEELRSQLSKLKVGEEAKSEQSTTPNPPPQINGEADKKDDSGNETGAGEHEPEDEEITVGYDKTKSFFDNISCEAAQDRSKNKKNDWRQERKLNSETFGVSSTRRGSYRGRGNYYNRNASNYNGGGNMGGYNRGYRGGNNYRNRSNNGRNMGGGGGNGGNSHANQGESNIPSTTGTGSGANGSTTISSKIQSNGASAVTAVASGGATIASVVAKATQEASKSTNVSAVGSGQ